VANETVRTFNVFFQKPKKRDFSRFLSCCRRFLEHWTGVSICLSASRSLREYLRNYPPGIHQIYVQMATARSFVAGGAYVAG